MRGRLRWPRQSPGWRWPCRLRTWRAWCLWPKIKIILKLYNNKINIFGFLRFQYWLLSSHLSPSSSGPWWPPSAPAAPCSSPCGPIRGEHVVTWPGLHQPQLTCGPGRPGCSWWCSVVVLLLLLLSSAAVVVWSVLGLSWGVWMCLNILKLFILLISFLTC